MLLSNSFKYQMIRSLIASRFSTKFYHDCAFRVLKDEHEDHSCQMANYLHVYRRYGHLYAKLDPLGIYDKYLARYLGNFSSLSGQPIWGSHFRSKSEILSSRGLL